MLSRGASTVPQSRDRLVRLIPIDPPVPFLESFLVAPKHIEDVWARASRPRMRRGSIPS